MDTSVRKEESVDLAGLTLRLSTLKEQIDKEELVIKQKREEYAEMSKTLLNVLDLLSIDKVSMHGKLFYKETKSSVTLPKTQEDKEALFEFLKEKGIFWEKVSIHSASLNSLYASLSEEALEKGILDFRIPGVSEPTFFTNLKIRKQ